MLDCIASGLVNWKRTIKQKPKSVGVVVVVVVVVVIVVVVVVVVVWMLVEYVCCCFAVMDKCSPTSIQWEPIRSRARCLTRCGTSARLSRKCATSLHAIVFAKLTLWSNSMPMANVHRSVMWVLAWAEHWGSQFSHWWFTCPLADIIWPVMIVARIRGKIIGTVLCYVVSDSCAQWYAHTHIQAVQSVSSCMDEEKTTFGEWSLVSLRKGTWLTKYLLQSHFRIQATSVNWFILQLVF